MKFEQVLQIYWSKGFLYNGKVLPFNLTLREFVSQLGGFNLAFYKLLIKRFELTKYKVNYKLDLSTSRPEILKAINFLLSQIGSVNNQLKEVDRFNAVRLYLIRSYRGKAQALGKPSHGQRTWSNAWTSYNYNRTVRAFVAEIQKTLKKDQVEEKINYKLIKRKVRRPVRHKGVVTTKAKTNVWF